LISSNNWLTDTKDELNDVINGNTKVLDDRKQFVYNYLKDGTASALFVKHFEQENPQQLELITDAGFKTDDKNDLGDDYADITKR
jgi:Ran GTPase-activating protein (RanGAP) involved in mRNA processing and transport